jgi:hypothetical protein
MPRPPDSAPDLKELQAAFGRSVRSATASPVDLKRLAGDDDATGLDQRLDVYRNNAWQFYLTALERTYPVTQRRVGAEFFRQLARDYRVQHPSRHGDLHWIGAAFPEWLADRMAGTDELPHLALVLQPSLQLVASPFPIWSVWQANQHEVAAAPVDLAAGAEHCAVACVADRVAVYRLDAADHRLLRNLQAGMSLGDATEAATSDAGALGRLLGWAFGEELVVQVDKRGDPSPCGRPGCG